MTDYRNTVIYADVRDGLRRLIDAGVRVNMAVCSPPYWSLRSYLNPDHPNKHLELGNELDPETYVENMVGVFRLVRELLAEDGTCHIVIGDSYMGTGGPGSQHEHLKKGDNPRFDNTNRNHPIIKSKDLCLIPFELARALRDDGWYLRSIDIWAKAISGQNELLNIIQAQFGWDIALEDLPVGTCMPSSVKDRTTVGHEYVIMLSKSERYFWDYEATKEGAKYPEGPYGLGSSVYAQGYQQSKTKHPTCNNHRNRRSVWFVPTRGYSGAHFAAYPPDLIAPIILAGTSAHGTCPKCHRQYKRIITKGAPLTEQQRACGADSQGEYHGTSTKEYKTARAQDASETKKRILQRMRERKTVRWEPGCKCDAGEPMRALVLDPFIGSGTTAAVAERLGRHWLGIELNEDYRILIEERTAQQGLFK